MSSHRMQQVPPQPVPGDLPVPPRPDPGIPAPVEDPGQVPPPRRDPDVNDPAPSPDAPPMIARTSTSISRA